MENSCVNFPRVRYQYKGLPRFEPLWMRVVAQANRGENLWSSAQKSLYPCIKGDENWNPDFKTRTARPHNPTKRPSLIEELSQVAELQHFLGGAGYVNRYIRRRRGTLWKGRRIGSSLRRSAGSFHNYDFQLHALQAVTRNSTYEVQATHCQKWNNSMSCVMDTDGIVGVACIEVCKISQL